MKNLVAAAAAAVVVADQIVEHLLVLRMKNQTFYSFKIKIKIEDKILIFFKHVFLTYLNSCRSFAYYKSIVARSTQC
jgi:hypothetical protein